MPIETPRDFIRIRVKNPALFKPATYKTIQMTPGIKYVAGKLKNPPKGKEGSMVIQTFLFDKKKWTKDRAANWIKQHGYVSESENIEEYIKKTEKGFCVFSHQTGKNFGCYRTRSEAEARLKQIKKFSKNN
jgi:hypothetical protein